MAEAGKNSGCLVCGEALVYREKAEAFTCAYCGKPFEAHEACAAGHYICDSCHSLGAFDVIREFCLTTEIADPLRMATAIMRRPAIHMHGPEHHYLVPAVLIAAYCRASGRTAELPALLSEAEKRAKTVPGGYCGFYGSCGAGIGTGIFVSIVTGATPLSKETWGLANKMTSRSLSIIAEGGGPRCCKRDSYAAIREAALFAAEKLGVSLSVAGKTVCGFYPKNRECLKEECPYYPA